MDAPLRRHHRKAGKRTRRLPPRQRARRIQRPAQILQSGTPFPPALLGSVLLQSRRSGRTLLREFLLGGNPGSQRLFPERPRKHERKRRPEPQPRREVDSILQRTADIFGLSAGDGPFVQDRKNIFRQFQDIYSLVVEWSMAQRLRSPGRFQRGERENQGGR